MQKKVRADSRLKTMAPERQAQIVDWSRTLTLHQLKERVRKELGVETNTTSLSEFLSYWHLSQHLEQAAGFSNELKETLKTLPDLKLDEEQINAAAQVVFELDAAKNKDLGAFLSLRRLRQKDKDQLNEARRIQLLEKKAAQAEEAEKTVKDETLTPEERMNRMRQIFGMQ